MSTTKNIPWTTGTGNITVVYDGSGNGTITVTTNDNNLYEQRSQKIVVSTTAGSPQRSVEVTITQAARQRIDLSNAVVTTANQTYSGSALTPAPTVTLGGETVPSTGYDVTYSNNTNAGTATVTVTGKGDYTGIASGNFTINKAHRTMSFAYAWMTLSPEESATNKLSVTAPGDTSIPSFSITTSGYESYASINSSTGKVTGISGHGGTSMTVEVSYPENANYLADTLTYDLYVFKAVLNKSTVGTSSVTLPPGRYTFECWGAQGGSIIYTGGKAEGGKGGYSKGAKSGGFCDSPFTCFLVVGGAGTTSTTFEKKITASYNGGGAAWTGNLGGGCSGGGGTHISIGSDSMYARVLVAGGGGGAGMYGVIMGAAYRYDGGHGGGSNGTRPSYYSVNNTKYYSGGAGTPTANGYSYKGTTANDTTYYTLATFGSGAGFKPTTADASDYSYSGGGGGWYGGGASYRGAGGGGSGYYYSFAKASQYPSGCLLDSSHYLSNAKSNGGTDTFLSPDGVSETGHSGNGYIRITRTSGHP